MKFLCVFFIFCSPSLHALHLVLDPGHGGKDQGAVQNGVKEARVVWEITEKLHNLLSQEQGIRVTLTRGEKQTQDLKKRALKASKIEGDIFISIHANSSPDPKMAGGEVYIQNQMTPEEASLFLAHRENKGADQDRPWMEWPLKPLPTGGNQTLKSVLQDLQRTMRFQLSATLARTLLENWQGKRRSNQTALRQAPFYLVKSVNMPSVLVEVGYLSHAPEAKRLTRPGYQEKIAKGLLHGIKSFSQQYRNFKE